jgi:hypothetical protein
MVVEVRDEVQEALRLAGFSGNLNLLAAHLSEIEVETENWLDILTTLRSYAYRGDDNAVIEAMAELTISMEHLHGHIQQVLPDLQKQLGIEE